MIDPYHLRKLYLDRKITREQYKRGLSVVGNRWAFETGGLVGLTYNIIAKRRTEKLLKGLR